jgi:hypothetical protein
VYGRNSSPDPGISVSLSGPATLPSGTSADGHVTVRNNSSRSVTFYTGSNKDEAELLDSNHEPVSAVNWTDVIGMQQVALKPGQSTVVVVPLNAYSCADTHDESAPPLPRGNYFARASLPWQSAGRSGSLVTSEIAIQIS